MKEPFRLVQWEPKKGSCSGRLFTCARPGRSNEKRPERIPDETVDAWVKGLPPSSEVVIVSLLGQKKHGASEFRYYSFRGGKEAPADRPNCPTFQEWLNERHGCGYFTVVDYPTVDRLPVPPAVLSDVASRTLSLLSAGRTVVLMDSGGISRTGSVARHIGYVESKNKNYF
jgi:hypothetical protein